MAISRFVAELKDSWHIYHVVDLGNFQLSKMKAGFALILNKDTDMYPHHWEISKELGDLNSAQTGQLKCLFYTCTDLVNRLKTYQNTDWLVSNSVFSPVQMLISNRVCFFLFLQVVVSGVPGFLQFLRYPATAGPVIPDGTHHVHHHCLLYLSPVLRRQ